MKSCTDSHVPLRMNPRDFDDSLTFSLAPPSDSHLLVKCLNNYFTDWHKIWHQDSYSPQDVCHHFVDHQTIHLAS